MLTHVTDWSCDPVRLGNSLFVTRSKQMLFSSALGKGYRAAVCWCNSYLGYPRVISQERGSALQQIARVGMYGSEVEREVSDHSQCSAVLTVLTVSALGYSVPEKVLRSLA